MKKLWPVKVKGVKNSKKKPPNDTKANSQKPTKFIVISFVVIRIQRWFVKL